MGTKIVFYTQRPVHKHPDHLKDAGVKLILKVFGADWISPCLGDVRYDKVSRNFRYVPFCIKSVVYKKKWFRDGFVNIVSVGKFVERKNHHLLIRALTPLASESKIRLTIIGELSDVTGEDYYQKVMDMISSAPFEVQVENNLDQNEVFDIYKRNDLFVLASANEPASVSNLEAMSFGLPVVTSDTNQTSCYTQGNGAVFASGSVEDLTKKLSELISDRSKMVEMGRLSRSLVEKNHNSETVYADFLQNVSR